MRKPMLRGTLFIRNSDCKVFALEDYDHKTKEVVLVGEEGFKIHTNEEYLDDWYMELDCNDPKQLGFNLCVMHLPESEVASLPWNK